MRALAIANWPGYSTLPGRKSLAVRMTCRARFRCAVAALRRRRGRRPAAGAVEGRHRRGAAVVEGRRRRGRRRRGAPSSRGTVVEGRRRRGAPPSRRKPWPRPETPRGAGPISGTRPSASCGACWLLVGRRGRLVDADLDRRRFDHGDRLVDALERERALGPVLLVEALDVDQDDLAGAQLAERICSTACPRSRAGWCGAAAGHRAPGRSPSPPATSSPRRSAPGPCPCSSAGSRSARS